MFERLFKTQKNQEESERRIEKIVIRELSKGINKAGIYFAFKAAQKENETKNLGLTNNFLLNKIKDMAAKMISVIESNMYGGMEQAMANINSEIEKIRQGLTEEERKN